MVADKTREQTADELRCELEKAAGVPSCPWSRGLPSSGRFNQAACNGYADFLVDRIRWTASFTVIPGPLSRAIIFSFVWLYDLRIDHPEQYFRQYFPVVRKGKKLIYVNAFPDEIPNWHQHLVVIMDGGICCWQAFYDPAIHGFLTLRVNGVA